MLKFKQILFSKSLLQTLPALLILFLLPLCVITFFSMNILFEEIRNSLLQIHGRTAQTIIREMDAQFEQLARVSSQIELHEFTSTRFVKGSPMEWARCQDVLNISKVGLDYADDVILYAKQNGAFYSPGSVYHSDQAFFNNLGVRNNNDLYKLDFALNRSKEPLFVTVMVYPNTYQQPQPVTFLLFPNSNSYDRRCVIFRLSVNYLPSIDEYAGNGFMVRDRSGTPVLQHDTSPGLAAYCATVSLETSDSFTDTVEDVNYFFSVLKGSFGYQYILYSPLSYVLSRMETLQKLLVTIVFLVALAGCVCIFLTLRVTYLPVKKLYQSLVHEELRSASFQDEYKAIVEVFESQSVENRMLRNTAAESRSQLKRYLFISLFTNKITDKQTMLSQLEQNGYILEYPYFSVFILCSASPIQELTDCLQQITSRHACACFLVGSKERCLHIFVYGTNDAQPASMQSFFCNVHRVFLAQFSEGFILTIGNLYPKVSMLAVSYNQAYALATMSSDSTLRLFDAVADYEYAELLNQKNWFSDFEEAIFHGETKRMSQILSDINYFIHNNQCSLACGRSICYSLADILLRTVYITREQRFNEANLYLPFSYLNMELNDKDSMIQFINLICRDLDIYLEVNEDRYSNQIFSNIKRYLEENFRDCNFMVQNLSDYFGMSYSNISSFFRQQQGETISNYLFSLRINEAKRLLAGTDLSVNEIVMEVGYSDPSSFVRKFKNAEGITPGAYRREHQRNNL